MPAGGEPRQGGSPTSWRARHRPRGGRRSPSAAALRGPHAPRAAHVRAAGALGADRRCRRAHRDPVPAATPARVADRRSRASRGAARAALLHLLSEPAEGAAARANRCACSATRVPATSVSRWCIRSGRRSPKRAAARSAHARLSYDRGLSQETLRKLVARTMAADPRSPRTHCRRRQAPQAVEVRRCRALSARAAAAAHAERAASLDERTHPAWTRLKFDELLAQQPRCGRIARRARGVRRCSRAPAS